MFKEILDLYKQRHLEIHGEEYKESWGDPVYKIKMYTSGDSYITVQWNGQSSDMEVQVNMTGSVEFKQELKEEELPRTIDVATFLDGVKETLRTANGTPMNPDSFMIESGKTAVRTVVEKVEQPDYEAYKAKAEMFDRLVLDSQQVNFTKR